MIWQSTSSTIMDDTISILCELCGEYLCCATETVCNHLFCEGCLSEYLLYLNECPQCRTKIRNQISYSNKILDELILQHIQAEDYCELQRFKLRLERHHSFKRSCSLQANKLAQGQSIDILDNNHVWCTGKIIKLIDKHFDHQINQILVRYDGSKRKEVIELPTSRIAVKGSYTQRNEIPHYYRKKIVFEDKGETMELVEWETDSSPQPQPQPQHLHEP